MALLRRLVRRVRERSIRHMLSRLGEESHGSRATYVGNNRVLVKSIVANANLAFYVEADDRLISPWFIITGRYEVALTNYFVSNIREKSHCVDVGANFGYFTCLMARFCPAGKVIGIEPDRHVYEIVRDNIFINGLHNATAIHAAAADHTGEISLFRRVSRSGNTSIVHVNADLTEYLGEVPAQPFTVATTRLDDLLDRLDGRVDYVKIDVEGSEPLVIAGAAKLIETNPQISIVMEWSPGQIQAAGFDLSDFIQSLKKLHLRAYDLQATRLVPLSYDQVAALPYRAGIVLKR